MTTLTGAVDVEPLPLGKVASFPVHLGEGGLPLGGIDESGAGGGRREFQMCLVEPVENRLPRCE